VVRSAACRKEYAAGAEVRITELGETTVFEYGDRVLVTSQKGRIWLVKIVDGPFSCHLGTIDLNRLVGLADGDSLVTGKGARLFLFTPSLCDCIFKLKRRTQIIYPKDLGTMLFYGDVYPGLTVLESGIGSGALSLALLRAIGSRGRLISVENRLEFAQMARANVQRFGNGSARNHSIIVADVQDVALRGAVDRVFLDLPEPWVAVETAAHALKRGGLLVSLSPQVSQVQLTHRELRRHGFSRLSSFEILKRDWEIDDRRARPTDRMVAHTGFITMAKKVDAPTQSEPA